MLLSKKRGLYETNKVVYLALDAIAPSVRRAARSHDARAMRDLTQSIEKYGVLQPLTVRRADSGYELISGERRLIASRSARLDKVPCIVLDVDERESDALMLVENVQRRGLDFVEEAHALAKLREHYGYSQETLAQLVGLSQPAVANKLRLLRLPSELLLTVRDAGLSERHARALLRLPDEREMAAALTQMLAEDMTVAQAEELVDRVLTGEPEPVPEPTPEPPTPRGMTLIVRDYRFYVNSIERGAETMRRSGIAVDIDRADDEKQVTMTVRIAKRG
jgi:ParB family chromosome partitioning protein